MKKQVFNYFLKISILTFIFFSAIWMGAWLIKAWTITIPSEKNKESEIEKQIEENKKNFKSAGNETIGNIAVAISTNVWIRFKQKEEIPISIYKDVMDISYIVSNKQIAKDKLISQNMILLNEYLNVLKTDVKSMLNQSYDRSETLDAYIAQLEYRYKKTLEVSKILNMQKDELEKTLNKASNNIENIKVKISNDFKKFDSTATIENIDNYLVEREEYTYARTYIIFINKFLSYYNILNWYNKKLLDTLINNKEIIVKNTQIIIPDTWTDILRKMDLIYTEEDWKEKTK